jgi:eukaryotic-like serine/threonine-protein kinase
VTTTPVGPGEVLAGRYRVAEVIGAGGMGVVVAADHLILGERVAIKFLLPEAAVNDDIVSRFLREARAAARIQSRHVARVMDVGELEHGGLYIVMEYLEGRDLSGELTARGPLPIEEAVNYVLQAAIGLSEAHALGIVHRDLKPSNLFLTRLSDGRNIVKVLDFGVAKHLSNPNEGTVTRTSVTIGSAAYMSPEQVRGLRDVDHRSDVWALGVVLFELLTNDLPFDGESVLAIASAITSDEPRPLRARRPDAPVELESLIRRCLERDRDQRMSTLATLSHALVPFGGKNAAVLAGQVSDALSSEAQASRVRRPSSSDASASDPSVAARALAPTVQAPKDPEVAKAALEPSSPSWVRTQANSGNRVSAVHPRLLRFRFRRRSRQAPRCRRLLRSH